MKRLPIIKCLLVAVAYSIAPLFAQSDESAATWLQELERSRALLNSVESHTNHLDAALAEPLMQVGDQLMTLGRHDEAHEMFDRALQIVRINEGLYARSQLPYQQKKIANFMRGNNWELARDNLQHLFWLLRKKSPALDELLVDDVMQLSTMHLRGVAEDTKDYQYYHLQRAGTALRMAEIVGDRIWADNDPSIVPVLYSQVKHFHLKASAVQSGSQVAYQLRTQIPTWSDWTHEKQSALRFYYLSGRRLLQRIRSVYEQAEPANPEAIAMAELYIADWQVLFGRTTEALQSYRSAYEKLQGADLDPVMVSNFFSQPTLVPEPHFYDTLTEALDARADRLPVNSELALAATSETMYFNEWTSSFPSVRPPITSNSSRQPESAFALFSFSLAGVTDLARLLNGKEEDEFAFVTDARIVEPEEKSKDEEKFLLTRLESLRFRPRLQDGVPQESAATLMYQLAGDVPR